MVEFCVSVTRSDSSAQFCVPSAYRKDVLEYGETVAVLIEGEKYISSMRRSGNTVILYLRCLQGNVEKYIGKKWTVRIDKLDTSKPSTTDLIVGDEFNWEAVMPHCYTENDMMCNLTYRGSLFNLKRRTSLFHTLRLLGIYQAEGNKNDNNKNGMDFSIPNTNPYILRYCSDVLESVFGISKSRQWINVTYSSTRSTHEEAEYRFKTCGVELANITKLKTDETHAKPAGILHVGHSKDFITATNEVLKKIIFNNQLDSKTVLAYLLGHLDGDGSIVLNRVPRISDSGSKEEVTFILDSLSNLFNWPATEKTLVHEKAKFTAHINLNGIEVCDLLETTAFIFSYNRAKLLLYLKYLVEQLSSTDVGGMVAHGYIKNGEITFSGQRLIDTLNKHKDEIEGLASFGLTSLEDLNASTDHGKKCVLYPLMNDAYYEKVILPTIR